jgi:3-oxoacyl-[acyl-carrier-protein] synthase III
MSLSTLHNVRLAGIASCVPKHIISNLTDCPPKLRHERQRLVRNIGIETRRICPEWQCFSDLAFEASEKLIAELNWERCEIDALIVITQSPDYLIPSTAIILQDRLGLPKSTIAFDVNLGCSGYPFGIHLLGSMIAAGSIKKALLLIGDKSARLIDPLFSDAGTATALEYSADASPIYFDLNSDGSGYRAIMLPVGGHREPYKHYHSIPSIDENGLIKYPADLILDGPAILSFSTQEVPPAVEKLLKYSGLSSEQIDYFLFHQANQLINETIRKKLKLPVDKVPSTLKEFGNSSGASIPLTITAKLQGQLSSAKSHKLLLSGFGVGLSWGGCILDVEHAKFPVLIES